MDITRSLSMSISHAVYQDGKGIWRPTTQLLEFANLLGWPHDGTFQSIFKAGQASVPRDERGNLRKIRQMGPNGENTFTGEMKSYGLQLLDGWFEQSGNQDIFLPSCKHYHYLVFLSNWLADALPRVQCVNWLLTSGIKIDELVILGSINRPGPPEKSLAALKNADVFKAYGIDPVSLPTDEMNSICWLLDHLIEPSLLEGVNITKVPAQMITRGDQITSPNTRSSMVDWRIVFCSRTGHHEWKPGNVLAVSNGWQFPRGRIIVESELLSWQLGFEDCGIETVGGHPGYNHPFSVRVAEFNRYLWEVNSVLEKFTS